jgi:hypothetical protein
LSDLLAIERELRERLLAFPPAMRGALLRILWMPSWEGAHVIGSLYRTGMAKQLSELLMDLDGDRYALTVVLALLAEIEHERN